eukprot:1089483-Rhodomonas_salina.1
MAASAWKISQKKTSLETNDPLLSALTSSFKLKPASLASTPAQSASKTRQLVPVSPPRSWVSPAGSLVSTPIKKGALCPKVHEEEASTHCAVAFVTLEHAESSFFSFVDEHQEEHRQLHPGAKDDDIAELLRVAGNTLSADEQVEYDDRVTEMRSLLFCNLDVAVSLRLETIRKPGSQPQEPISDFDAERFVAESISASSPERESVQLFGRPPKQ